MSESPDYSFLNRENALLPIIPQWLLFGAAFVTGTKLTAAIFQGRMSDGLEGTPANLEGLFPQGFEWVPVEISEPRLDWSMISKVDYRDAGNDAVWDSIQNTNAFLWNTACPTFVSIAGTDSCCILARTDQIEKAFGAKLSELDLEVSRRVEQTIDYVGSHRPHPIDDVWLRNFAWLQRFRLTEPPR